MNDQQLSPQDSQNKVKELLQALDELLKIVETKKDGLVGWKSWFFIHRSLSNTMFLAVVLGGLISSSSAFAADQIKRFIDPKIVGGFAGALVVAAKLAEDNFRFRKESEKYGGLDTRAERIVMAIRTGKIALKQEAELTTLLIESRKDFLSLFDESGDSDTPPQKQLPGKADRDSAKRIDKEITSEKDE